MINNNNEFLEMIKKSFLIYLEYGSRSNKKLEVLHGYFAEQIKQLLGNDYNIESLGIGNGKEAIIKGRYADKKVDIVIKNKNTILGVSLKFVMQNYKQNKVNYFENLLGETANIRTKDIPYFHILVMFDKMPYFDKESNIKKWEIINCDDFKSYFVMGDDNKDKYFHTPTKTLIILLENNLYDELESNKKVNKNDYIEFAKSNIIIDFSKTIPVNEYKNLIFNDIDLFIKKLYHYIKSL